MGHGAWGIGHSIIISPPYYSCIFFRIDFYLCNIRQSFHPDIIFFMKTFLDSVATHILDGHLSSPEGLVVVLPSRRAGAFLRRSLSHAARRRKVTFWMPQIYSIEDFFFTASGFEEADSTGLMMELFGIHREKEGSKQEELDQFLSWAPLMVSDFSAIDEGLADARQLFTFLSQAKAIEQWNPQSNSLSDGQKQYVAFFNELYTYYQELRQVLLKQGKAYKGMAARAVYESGVLKDHPKWEHFLFAGFYAHSRCEEELLKQLKKEGRLTRLVDADAFYMENPYHEAGHFFRKNFLEDKLQWVESHYRDQQKSIEILGTPGVTGQARLAGSLIHEQISEPPGKPSCQTDPHSSQPKDIAPEEIAVVLADEGMLLPLLNSLPEGLEAVNATMGYPIKNTSMASLIRVLLHAAMDRQRFGRKTMHKKELAELASLPVVQYLLAGQNPKPQALAQEQQLFFTAEEVESWMPEAVTRAVRAMDTPVNLLQQLIHLSNHVHEQLARENHMVLERHASQMMSDRLGGLGEIFQESHPLASFKDLNKLVQKTILNGTLPFTGEPLQGIQIMGMLESRALDFKYVIILSANEGSIPAGKGNHSLIPYDIQKKFGLATYGDSDSIYAYHFYRLIQRAKQVRVIYNTEPASLGGNEKSRFIRQMLYELPGYNKNLTISEKLIPPQPAAIEPEQIKIPANPRLTSDIRRHLESKGLSATAIRSLTKCSLQFYFKYLLKLHVPEEPEETIPMHTFGHMLHKVLEETYMHFLNAPGKAVTAEYLEQAKEQTSQMVVRYLKENKKEYSPQMLKQGRNKLMTDLATDLLKRFFASEARMVKNIPLEVVSLEEKMTHQETIAGCQVAFNGLADRIDRKNGTLRIMDYKTGNVQNADLSQSNAFECLEDLKTGELIQVLFYDWLYGEVNNNDQPREGGIFLLTKPEVNSIFFKYDKQQGITPQIRQRFKKALMQQVEKLLDPQMTFKQTDDEEDCQYCDYQNICNR